MSKTDELLLKVRTLLEDKKYNEAIAFLPDNVLNKFNSSELYFCRAWAHYQMNDEVAATFYKEKAIILDPDLHIKFNQYGIDLFNKGEFEKAIAEYNKALLISENFATACYNMGLAFYDMADYEKAIFYYNKAITLNPDYSYAFVGRGLAWYYMKEYDKAIADYDKAIKIKPDDTNAILNKGLAWYYKGDYNKAIDDFSKTIELDKNYSRAYYNRGLSWYNLKDNDKAIEDFSKAITLDHDNTDAYFNRALAFYYKGDYEKSIADNDKVIATQPGNADAYLNRGLAWNYKGEYDKAIADYNEVLSLQSDYEGHAYINRGIAYYYKGQYNEAIEDYKNALKINDKTEFVHNNLGLAWFNKGFYDEAIKYYNNAIQLKPDFADAYINRAIAWFELDEFEKAIEDCTKTLELNANSADAFNTRGNAWYFLKNFEKAREDFRMVAGFIGYEAIGNTNMGDVSSALGEFQKANLFYEQAEQDNNIPDWLRMPVKQKKDRNNQRMLLLRTNVPIEDIIKQVHIEDKTENTLQKIRKISKSDARNIVHYTKLFVADIYVSSLDSKMHYSNAIYMNDPMEGQVIFEYLNDKKIIEAYLEGEKRYENSVYLGSFLPVEESGNSKSHEDELVMWRTYGKDENGKEAAGCNLVLRCDFFKKAKKQVARDHTGIEAEDDQSKLAMVKEDYSKNKGGDEELLNVVYIEFHNKSGVIKNDPSKNLKPAMEELKKLLTMMVELRDASKKREFSKYIENTIFKQLSTISFLFKSADYMYENEVRVIKNVPRDSELIKSTEVKIPGLPKKRLYIESNNEILPFIKKIHLGPKVENHQQWSLYFDFEIRQRAREIAAMVSPPFELRPSEIEILKSECKFQ